MRLISFALLLFLSFTAFGQKKDFTVLNLSLPPEIADANNQFSGLYIHDDKLFLLSESRLQNNAEAKLYAINLSDLERNLSDSAFKLPFKKYLIYNLQILRDKMRPKGDEYEGLEAMVITGDEITFTVETTTPSPNCYILKGHLNDSVVILDKDILLPIPKPLATNGSHIYNAGFEALAIFKKRIFLAFFEYNYFTDTNFVHWIDDWSFKNEGKYHPVPIKRLPFRITDITATGKSTFTAINFFFKGEGKDEVYRVAKKDKKNYNLITDSGGFHNYCRLVEIKYKNASFTRKSLWEFPIDYMGYNWEGLAAYKNGYFIINDKYTPAKPYKTVLLYLKAK